MQLHCKIYIFFNNNYINFYCIVLHFLLLLELNPKAVVFSYQQRLLSEIEKIFLKQKYITIVMQLLCKTNISQVY